MTERVLLIGPFKSHCACYQGSRIHSLKPDRLKAFWGACTKGARAVLFFFCFVFFPRWFATRVYTAKQNMLNMFIYNMNVIYLLINACYITYDLTYPNLISKLMTTRRHFWLMSCGRFYFSGRKYHLNVSIFKFKCICAYLSIYLMSCRLMYRHQWDWKAGACGKCNFRRLLYGGKYC